MQTRLILTLLAAWLAGCSQGQQNEGADETAIRTLVQSQQEAYNQYDAAKFTANWAQDATYTNPLTGEDVEGKAEVEKLFKEKFADGKKRHLEVGIKGIEFPSETEAVVRGVIKWTMEDQPPQDMVYKAIYVKENGKWLVQSYSEIELQTPTSNFELLKDLAWLVGKWKDADENVEIVFDNQWDKYKNFITQHFKMSVHGQDAIEGKQIIAWDPVKEEIRSWVFDSDGEFGEGTWKNEEKSWYATMHYTLSDGRIGTAKNIFTQVDDTHYTFASVEREVDGEILPDINPVTVVKIK